MRRGAIAASIALAFAVLVVSAAAARVALASAVFWILAAGIGISVMLVAGLLEAHDPRTSGCRYRFESPELREIPIVMVSNEEVDRVVEAARQVPPAEESYIEEDFVMNLMETVLDYQMNTKAVVAALQHFKDHHRDELRTREDLRALFARYPEDKEGNTALAQYLWGYNLWTRAQQLRDLTVFFRRAGVVDQESLKAWAAGSTFENDFEGKVKGLGIAVYHWLVMRQGVDTVKPDVHVHRFAEAAVGRPLSDADVVEVVTRAAHELGKKAYELDWAIWEASRGGALPYPGSGPPITPESP